MLAAAFVLTCLATPAAAQDAGPNAGDLHVSGALDFSNAYFFRGIKQENDGLILQPYLDVGLALYKGEGSLKTFSINFGTWNSIHHDAPTGAYNPDNPNAPAPWYESDFYATMGFGVSGGVTASMTYTVYTSPSSRFSDVKELSFKFAVDDSKFGKFSVKPYGIIATEFDTGTGTGQADAGFCQTGIVNGCVGAGTYVEFGGAPTFPVRNMGSVSVPMKVGIGLIDYYQAQIPPRIDEWGTVFPTEAIDSKFGFASIAVIGTLPFAQKPTRFGNWNVHGGVEYQILGKMARYAAGSAPATPDAFPTFESNQWIYSVGLGFSY